MNKFKFALKILMCMLYGGISGYWTPTCLLMAFNFLKGIQHNPDGELFVPVGILALVLFLIIDIVIVVKTALSESMTKSGKLLVVALFLVVKAGLLLSEQLGLQLFVECFRWKLEHQW